MSKSRCYVDFTRYYVDIVQIFLDIHLVRLSRFSQPHVSTLCPDPKSQLATVLPPPACRRTRDS